jgi:hypothetical protein
MLLKMEDRMESLMLLGGQFLQARIRDEYRCDRIVANRRERAYWESLGECGSFAAYGLVSRLLAALVVFCVLFAALMATEPAESGAGRMACAFCAAQPGVKTQPSFTPFKLAIWSESIGR